MSSDSEVENGGDGYPFRLRNCEETFGSACFHSFYLVFDQNLDMINYVQSKEYNMMNRLNINTKVYKRYILRLIRSNRLGVCRVRETKIGVSGKAV